MDGLCGSGWEQLRRNRRLLIFSGAALGINWICSFAAYKFADVSLVTICLYTYPVFLLLAAPFLFRERITCSALLCTAACVAGMFLTSGALTKPISAQTGMGIALSLIAAVFAAAVILCVKLLDGVDSLDITIVQLAAATTLLLPYGLLTGAFQGMRPDVKSVLLLLAAGILQTGVAYYLQFAAVKRLKNQLTAILSYVDPLVAVLLSMLVLGESMDGLQLLGAALILCSTLVNQLFAHRSDAPPPDGGNTGSPAPTGAANSQL